MIIWSLRINFLKNFNNSLPSATALELPKSLRRHSIKHQTSNILYNRVSEGELKKNNHQKIYVCASCAFKHTTRGACRDVLQYKIIRKIRLNEGFPRFLCHQTLWSGLKYLIFCEKFVGNDKTFIFKENIAWLFLITQVKMTMTYHIMTSSRQGISNNIITNQVILTYLTMYTFPSWLYSKYYDFQGAGFSTQQFVNHWYVLTNGM